MTRIVALVFAVLAAPALAADATAELVARLSALQTLQGDFTQTTLDQDDTRLQEAAGEMVLARGNRFWWHTTEPFEQLAVSDGVTLWVYDVDLEQVIQKPMNDQIANTPALLFSGDPASVSGAFSVEVPERGDDTVVYLLRPKADDALFSRLEVRFTDERPVAMRLEDALGQKTLVEFIDLKVNRRVDEARFRFEPPEGADVIQQHE